MPLLYQLGSFQFHGMQGTPDFCHARISGETRPGVNGDSLFLLGTSGRPFELQTIVGLQSYGVALLAAQAYIVAERMDPLPLIIANVVVPNGKFKVMHVRSQVHAAAVFQSNFGTIYNAGVVRATWSLLPMIDLALA